MNAPREMRFTKTHEWARLEGDVVTVGITDFAQQQLSDLTFAELPAVGDAVSARDEVAVLESVKAASDVYSPVSGQVVEVNEQLVDHPEIINSDPYGEGWMFKVKVEDSVEYDVLMDQDQYEETLPDGD